jgi:hypothetical protein
MKFYRFALIISFSVFLLAACGGSSDAPAAVVENYVQALADGDADKMAQLSCADWEDDARLSADSFIAVETTLNDVSCKTTSTEGDTARVDCTGSIGVSYNGEDRSVDLAGHTYSVTKQGGDWLVCGQE